MHSILFNTSVIYFETPWPNFKNTDKGRNLSFEKLIGNGARSQFKTTEQY